VKKHMATAGAPSPRSPDICPTGNQYQATPLSYTSKGTETFNASVPLAALVVLLLLHPSQNSEVGCMAAASQP
jgi:hypothetical protein